MATTSRAPAARGIGLAWASKRPVARLVVTVVLAACVLPGCDEDAGSIAEDAVLVVGERVFTSTDLAEVDAQLGPWAAARFRGPEGQRMLMEALTDAELMAQAAVAAGLGEDPRVAWALVEELAALELAAELERRVPLAETQNDRAALRAEWEAHPERYSSREQRAVRGVLFPSFAEADAALAKLRAEEASLEALGDVVETPLLTFDPKERPGFDVILFDPALQEGDVLPSPVVNGTSLMVGVVGTVRPARVLDFDEPDVQARVAEAVHTARVDAARAAYLAEVARR